jgi:hypothetical protein
MQENMGSVYTGRPILIFLSTNWSFDQSHQIFSHQLFFPLIGQRPISEKNDRNWAACLNAAIKIDSTEKEGVEGSS